ncbi:MAG: DUF1549 domain-containing protein [Verrucomicrobiota bacterium]
MEDELQPTPPPRRSTAAGVRNALFVLFCLGSVMWGFATFLAPKPLPQPRQFNPSAAKNDDFQSAVRKVDAVYEQAWAGAKLQPAPRASDLAIARRLSLGLMGTVPSLPEIRAFEAQPQEQRLDWWLSVILEDRGFSDFVAERLARAYVGVENGPFLVYRRHRLVEWLSDEVQQNRPYDQLVRSLIDAEGVWTSQPEANFITVSVQQNMDKKGPDEIKLAARVTRAFLGVRIDCMQCHDDKFGDHWKQQDFHQLAAFFGHADVSLTGVRDDAKLKYEYRFKGKPAEEVVNPAVPFHPELLPQTGNLRERLAGWVTHPLNRAFARTTVNRVWAMLFGQPLVEPIDDIPLEGTLPPAMEVLAEDLVRHKFDLHRLIRVIAATKVFQLDSRSADPQHPVTELHERHLAAFPLTRLRPEQVAGSVVQSCSLETIDAQSHILWRITRALQQSGFVKRYGDLGDNEFAATGGTIPQRLLLMNGELVQKRTEKNLVMNAPTRIGSLAPDDATAVETAYLTALTRRPTAEERELFTGKLKGTKGDPRSEVMQDLYWALINSTEFAWNH